jgi:predicted RecB family nuclease
LELASTSLSKSSLGAYDEYYLERIDVLEALDTWFEVGGEFPTSPYWHRECLTCEFQDHCERELEAVDDVSLTRFTSIEQQHLLRSQGVATRAALAHLDPLRAVQLRAKTAAPDERFSIEDVLCRSIERLDELIYRARAHVRDTPLRILDVARMGCPTADVEVDIDMESYGDRTYLWGASVTVRGDVVGIVSEHATFVEWGELSRDAEAQLFANFWSWFIDLRARCHDQGRSFAAYCFWAQAEDGAMNRAVDKPVEGGPTKKDLDEFRRSVPTEWIDIHDVAKAQIQTEGPLGLKQLAMAAGFHWRDANPSGEASMLWYEVATRQHGDVAFASRQRILDYNEDDCRATRALRDWLNGGAQQLAHRDDLV